MGLRYQKDSYRPSTAEFQGIAMLGDCPEQRTTFSTAMRALSRA